LRPRAGRRAATEDRGHLVAAAAHGGLGYLQHIVAVVAGTDGDRFTYHATDGDDLAAVAGETDGGDGVRHARVHADLLVFLHGGDDYA